MKNLTEGKTEKNSSKSIAKKVDKIESHASKINEFISIFSKFKEIKEDIIRGDQRHRIYQSLYNYMQLVKEHLVKDNLFAKLSVDEIEEILDIIENYIIKKLSKK